MFYDTNKKLLEGSGDTEIAETLIYAATKTVIDAVKKSLGMSKLTDYASMRQLVGMDTLAFNQAVFNELMTFLQYDANSLTNAGCFFACPAQSKEAQQEISYTLIPMSKTESNIRAAKDFLNPVAHDSSPEASLISDFNKEVEIPVYHIEIYLNNVYISVEEGFLKAMEKKTCRLEFFSSVLKAMYSVSRINNVNRSAWYRKYLEVLGASI